MWRPRSDIGTLQAHDAHFKFDKDATLTGATLFIRAPKEAQQKHSALDALSEKSMCPVFTLFTFMEKTEQLRSELPVEHTVFLAYVNNPSKARSIQPSTVANIVKQAGIDTQVYGPHSLRSASSTKAVQLGHKIDNVKKHANWSLSADTFERFYFKPLHQERTSQHIMGSIFSSSENSTTSEVEMEATVRLCNDLVTANLLCSVMAWFLLEASFSVATILYTFDQIYNRKRRNNVVEIYCYFFEHLRANAA